MTFSLAFVSGATGGLGKEIAYLLAEKRIPLLLTATSADALEELAASLRNKTQVEVFPADLSVSSSRTDVLNLIRTRAPDLVINNAGFGLYGEALSHSSHLHTNLVNVNATSAMAITLEAAKALIEKGSMGTILTISSATAFFSVPFFATYAASKAFINNFSEAFAREVAPQGIRVLVTCPGQIDTPFAYNASQGSYKKKKQHTISAKRAAAEIWKQIEKGPRIQVIDGFYRLLTAFTRLLPRKWAESCISREILKRVEKS